MAAIIAVTVFLGVDSGRGARVLLVLLLLRLLFVACSVLPVVVNLVDSHGSQALLDALQRVSDGVDYLIRGQGLFCN